MLPHRMSSKSISALVFGVASAGTVAYCCKTDNDMQRELRLKADAVRRVSNLVSTVAVMSADYGYQFVFNISGINNKFSTLHIKQRELERLQHLQEQYTISMLQCRSEEKAQWRQLIEKNRTAMQQLTNEIAALRIGESSQMQRLHQRNARRLHDMCARNGGLYIKLGQHLAMLDYIVPREYQESLYSLLSDNPTTDWQRVHALFLREFGSSPEQLFDRFETTPIASASLAQVHVAYRGEVKYAVKVQHDGLLESSFFDRWIITLLVERLLPLLFPEFNYKWLTDEMNKNVPLELNFELEAANLERCRCELRQLVAAGDVALPSLLRECCSQRVLTMSFEDGCCITDQPQIEHWQLSKQKTAFLISKVFWEQIFRHGFIHCDPHEGNLLVRPHPSGERGRPQLVLLDHGLYRELSVEFRLCYCRLWQALVLSDEREIEAQCRLLNAGAAFSLLAAIVTRRPWDDLVSNDFGRLNPTGSASESVMLQSYAQRYFKEIVQLLGAVLSEMLLVAKTNDCLRHLDKLLGAPVNAAAVAADTVSDVLLEEELKRLSLWGELWQQQQAVDKSSSSIDSNSNSNNSSSNNYNNSISDNSSDGLRSVGGWLLHCMKQLTSLGGALRRWYAVKLRVLGLHLFNALYSLQQQQQLQ